MPALSAGSVVSLLYAGVFSSGIAYTLQAVGQKDADPTIASLILSLESVISAISGFFLLHQVLTRREVLGCVLMAAAIVLVQLPSGRAKPVEETTN
jgi:drug/metabolite transporter (DMT)-like permease